jgi:uncharacterized FlaG/YvyC family protein
MPRIDANVATQMADVQRPTQTERDRDQQALAAKLRDQKQAVTGDGEQVSGDDLRAAAARLQQVIAVSTNKQLSFSYTKDENTDEPVIVIKELGSDEVIRKIPGDEVVKVGRQIDAIIGMMFDRNA